MYSARHKFHDLIHAVAATATSPFRALPRNRDWTWEGWEKWEADCRREFPVRYFLRQTVPTFFGRLGHKFRNGYWWVMHRIHPRHRYHVVRTGLPPGYWDFDTQILHACFECLRRYVEIEVREWEGRENWRTVKGHDPEDEFIRQDVERRTEILALYDWWTKGRPARPEPWAKEPWDQNVDGHEADRQEQAQRDEDQEMLARLVKVRPFLWT